MSLVSLLKKKLADEMSKSKKDIVSRQRRQFNMMIDERLVDETKKMAAQFAVPRYCLIEHLLETGYYYLTRAIQSEEKAKMLRQHLINVHLIDSGIDDSEAILRIGEGSNISQLLFQVRPVLRSWQAYKHALTMAEKTRNIIYLQKGERKLMESVIMFALWIEQHHMDEPVNSDIDDHRLEDNLDNESNE